MFIEFKTKLTNIFRINFPCDRSARPGRRGAAGGGARSRPAVSVRPRRLVLNTGRIKARVNTHPPTNMFACFGEKIVNLCSVFVPSGSCAVTKSSTLLVSLYLSLLSLSLAVPFNSLSIAFSLFLSLSPNCSLFLSVSLKENRTVEQHIFSQKAFLCPPSFSTCSAAEDIATETKVHKLASVIHNGRLREPREKLCQ